MTRIKELRQAKGFTQQKFADVTGISLRTLQHYEQGSKDFDHARIDTLLKACVALNCKLEDVIQNEEYRELIRKLPN